MLTGQADAVPATPTAPEQSGDTQNTEPEKTPESASGQAEPTQTPKPSNSGRLVPYAEANGLWGYKNTSGQVVIEAVFSEAYEFDGDVALRRAERNVRAYKQVGRMACGACMGACEHIQRG